MKRLQAESGRYPQPNWDALLPALLDRAFASQLVPPDPTDEPAEKLLGRITGGRTNSAKTMNPCGADELKNHGA